MKSVLISIQPKWVEKIVKGEKIIEVRKTRPKIETPFKCYIYMSQGDLKDLGSYSEWIYKNRMKVVGEFVCDEIIKDERGENADLFATQAGLSLEEQKYYGKNKFLYGWHISELKIYDKPKELKEFCIPCKVSCENCKNPLYFECWCEEKGKKIVTRPPLSWCYVEDLGEEE